MTWLIIKINWLNIMIHLKVLSNFRSINFIFNCPASISGRLERWNAL